MDNGNHADYGSAVFAGWRAASADQWQQYLHHEFVNGLGDGSLDERAFVQYLIQDYIFLLHYSRAWSMAVVKSETVESMRIAAATVDALINEETRLHVGVCAEHGITERDLARAEEARENLSYTRYVMDTALSGDLLDLLAALAPCVFGYGEIGLRLDHCTDTTPAYRAWIDTYRDEAYQSVCHGVAGLIESVAASRLGDQPLHHPRWPGLCERFRMATALEVDFWGMGLRLARP